MGKIEQNFGALEWRKLDGSPLKTPPDPKVSSVTIFETGGGTLVDVRCEDNAVCRIRFRKFSEAIAWVSGERWLIGAPLGLQGLSMWRVYPENPALDPSINYGEDSSSDEGRARISAVWHARHTKESSLA